MTDSETVTFDDGPIPDGGYSWVILLCHTTSQMAAWGMICPFGVFISWFVSQGTYPGATATQFGWISGIFYIVVFGMSPLSNYITKLLPLKGQLLSPSCSAGVRVLSSLPSVTLAIAQTLLSLGLILSGFTTEIWQLALTQGVMCGLGVGLVSPSN